MYMSVLLYVHLKNDVVPILLPFPLYQGNTLSLTNGITYLVDFDCIQKVERSVHHSWKVGFKKPKTMLLFLNFLILQSLF